MQYKQNKASWSNVVAVFSTEYLSAPSPKVLVSFYRAT